MFFCVKVKTNSHFVVKFVERSTRSKRSFYLFDESPCSNICKTLIGCVNIIKKKVNPLRAKFIKWLNTLKQFVGKLPTNCLSVFDHFVGLAFKRLIDKTHTIFLPTIIRSSQDSLFTNYCVELFLHSFSL